MLSTIDARGERDLFTRFLRGTMPIFALPFPCTGPRYGPAAAALLGLACLVPAHVAHADVFDCSNDMQIIFRDTPCPGGKNLSQDPEIIAILKASGPPTFFDPSLPAPPYTPLRSEHFSKAKAVQFFDRVASACDRRDFNAFFSTFEHSIRWAHSKKSPEELAARMRRYCSRDYEPARLDQVRSAGGFSVLPTGRTDRGVLTYSLCWTPSGGDRCAFDLTAAEEGGVIVRDEF